MSANRLEKPFIDMEIQEAIFLMDKEKESNPTGFNIAFYQKCWDSIEEELLNVFQEFFDSKTINRSTNVTFIALVPKKGQAFRFSEFKPINLLTSICKIIAKVLFWCLGGVLHETIHFS